MKYLNKKFIVSSLMVCIMLLIFSTINVFAVTVGNQLLQPETGWQRYDDRNSNIIYKGTVYRGTWSDGETYTNIHHVGSTVKFDFFGTKLRIIGPATTEYMSDNVLIVVDGVEYRYNQRLAVDTKKTIFFEITSLNNGRHSVVISIDEQTTDRLSDGAKSVGIDAIDIDESGELLPYYKPINLEAVQGDSKATLSWDPVPDATGYKIKWGKVSGDYTNSQTVSDSVYTGYDVTSLTNGETYYFVISAIVDGDEREESDEAYATPAAPTGNKALLVVTMQNRLEKEYDLYMTEVNSFIDWYNDRANGSTSGNAYYVIDKDYNIGPFTSRKDYLMYDKILCFEVMEYQE